MKLAYPAFSSVLEIGGDAVLCLVIENQTLFRSFLCDMASAVDGVDCDVVLSEGDRIVEASKNAELLCDFIDFELNRRSLTSKVVAAIEESALSPDNYLQTQELLAEIERAVGKWAFSLSCDVSADKLSVGTLLKSVGVAVKCDYEGHVGEVEKILDYMELVREFDRDKLFVTVNMRAYFPDELIAQFQKTVLSHEYKVLMLESQDRPRLKTEKRITIDGELCEF